MLVTTYRFRLYPNRTQERLMEDTLETCRRLYNSLLVERRENDGKGFYEQKRSLVALKSHNKFLRAVHSQVLQDVVLRLDKASQAFSAGLSRYPRLKRKGRYGSFTYPQRGGFKIAGDRLKLSGIGSVKVRLHREISGTPKRCTIIRDVDRWFACIMVEEEERQRTATGVSKAAVGVNLGVANLAVLSDGTIFPNPKHLSHSGGRIKSLQRELSKKRMGSKNREKARISLAKAWRKVRRQRDDSAHKASRFLADNYRTIVFEELNIKNLVKNHNLASAIMDSAWGKLRRLTAYKAERRGGRAMFVNSRGTSQRCSGCGNVERLELSERIFTCSACGLTLDRDVNAARNILESGLERARVEEQPLLVQRRISKFAPVKQEASGFILR